MPGYLLHCQKEHYRIKPNSTLYAYYMSRNFETEDVCFNEIIALVKHHALLKRCFDERNPCMILCDPLLENIFQTRALHVTQVRAALAKSLVRLTVPEMSRSDPCTVKYMLCVQRFTEYRNPGTIVAANFGARVTAGTRIDVAVTGSTFKYKLTSGIRELYIQSKILQHEQILFTYKEACQMLSQYILAKKCFIMDIRNIEICIIDKDPLGAVFNCTAFHRSQVEMFMRRNLIPVPVGYQTESHTYQLRPRKS